MNKNRRCSIKRHGYTIIELIIAATITCLVFGVAIKLYKHFSTQGIQQDRETVFWTTYCSTTEAIREDLGKAVGIDFSDPSRILISTVQIDNTYRCALGTITWNLRDKRTLVRTSETGVSALYSFSGGLGRDEAIMMNFRKAP